MASGAGRRHALRVVNVGIREQLLISVAAGLALEGCRPIVHTYAPFLVERPLEQLKLDLGHQDVDVVLVSGRRLLRRRGRGSHAPGAGGCRLGKGALPGWNVHVPSHPDDVEALLRQAVSGGGRHYIRLAEDQIRTARAGVPNMLRSVRGGSMPDATVIAVGPILDRVLAATNGLNVQVLHAVTVRPFDHAGLRDTARPPTVVLADPYLEGTSAGEISQALSSAPHRLLSVGVPKTEHRRYGTRHDHDRAHGLDTASLHRRTARFIGESERLSAVQHW